MIVFSFSYAYASSGSPSIGTVSARGDVRVDGYTVQGNGTLFDGTAIETGQATATLRLENGTEITMATNSHSVVHADHLVLLQGKSELKASGSSFFLEADGLRVAPGGPNAFGVVSVGPENTVEVAAVTGEFRILDDSGLSLTHVSPGTALSLHQLTNPAGVPYGTPITEVGIVSFENGAYYLTTVEGTKYELVGKDFHRFVNDKVVVSGKLEPATTPAGIPVIQVSSIDINGPESFLSTTKGKVWLATLLAGGAAGIGIGVYEATKPPASP
jgi:hypothetical protein